MTFDAKILEFLLALEARLPPARGTHHAFVAVRDDAGEPKLGLNLSLPAGPHGGGMRLIHLESGDLDAAPGAVADAVANFEASLPR
jgi:hypothetical protein